MQAELPKVLNALVSIEQDGHETVGRKRAPWSDRFAGKSRALIDTFVENRLFVTELADDGSAVVTVAHEALLWHWPRVMDWVAQNRENLRVRARIGAAAERWSAESKSTDLLLPHGKPLVEAESLLEQGIELPAEESEFIEASIARERRVHRIRTGAVIGVAALAILAAFFAYFADHQRGRAHAEIEAETAKQTTNFMVGLFNVADPSEARGNSITAREIMDKGAARIGKELTAQPAIQATLMETMGTVYTSLGLYDQAARLLRSALDKRRALYGDEAPGSRTLDGPARRSSEALGPVRACSRNCIARRWRCVAKCSATSTSTPRAASMSSPICSAAGASSRSRSRCSAKRWRCARSCFRRAVPKSRRAWKVSRSISTTRARIRMPRDCCAKQWRCGARSTTDRIRNWPKRSTTSAS